VYGCDRVVSTEIARNYVGAACAQVVKACHVTPFLVPGSSHLTLSLISSLSRLPSPPPPSTLLPHLLLHTHTHTHCTRTQLSLHLLSHTPPPRATPHPVDNLQIREDPETGVFIKGVSTWPVTSTKDCMKLLDAGKRCHSLCGVYGGITYGFTR
jgi:hypothetical protein